MYEIKCDVAVIGAGPAGLAAALSAKENGAGNVLIIERDSSLGGILQQCIHPGFGLSYFNEELTGPEYYGRFTDKLEKNGVNTLLGTMVLEVKDSGDMICINSDKGMIHVKAKSTVLAMGCRERTRANIRIPGTRPAGVYTAGSAQRLINRQNMMVGKKVVILGSGDIGMIMARRLTFEGAEVVTVVEIMDYLAGLTRNKVQCLDDFNIPLLLSHTVTNIVGNQRVEGVYVAKVDEEKRPIKETEEFYECDTLLLSVGLIPENELSRAVEVDISPITNGPVVNQYMQTSISGLFACGNVVHVNDLVDNVSVESEVAGAGAAKYAMGKFPKASLEVKTVPGRNVRYICPHKVLVSEDATDIKLYFRVLAPELNVTIVATSGDQVLASKKVVKVSPGEMEYITVRAADVTGLSEDIIINVTGGIE